MDAWETVPPESAISVLNRAGVARALVSSTPDDGTVRLWEKAPGRIVPAVLGEMVSDPDPATSERVMQALLQMRKLDIEGLKEAYGQRQADTGGYRAKSA